MATRRHTNLISMQHVLRCWERQSDGSEYKKTLRQPGLCPDPAEGAYCAPANPLVGGEGLAVPSLRTPSPRSRPFGPSLSYEFRRRWPGSRFNALLRSVRHRRLLHGH